MNAPDKIYLAESDNMNGEVTSNFASSTPFRIHSSIAYIRKGALLEWANNGIKRVKENSSLNSIIARGAIAAFEDLIEKLNSM